LIDSKTAVLGGAHSLKTNFAWTLAGNLVYAGCQFGMLVVLAKLGSPQLVGQFALGLAVTAPVIMLSNLQLRGVLATDAKEEHAFSDYLELRFVTTGLALLTVAGLVVAAGYQRQTALVVLAVALTKGFESISDITYGFQQHRERMDLIAQSMILRGVAAIVALWLGVYLTGSVLVGCLGIAAGWAAVLVAYDLDAARSFRSSSVRWPLSGAFRQMQWKLARLYGLIVLSLPLGVVMMLMALNVNGPRYIIQHYSGERGLGVFAAVAYVMVAGTTVVNALGQSASPRLAQHYARGDVAEFWGLMRKLLGIGAVLGAAGILLAITFGAQILSTLFQPAYAAAADVCVWMMTAAAISYLGSFLGYGLTAARRFKVQAPLIFVVTVVTVASSIVLVPRQGLLGAAWATVLGAVVQLIGSALILRHAILAKNAIDWEARVSTRAYSSDCPVPLSGLRGHSLQPDPASTLTLTGPHTSATGSGSPNTNALA
jgi:O-antigen/teichoic acid export membrane protein